MAATSIEKLQKKLSKEPNSLIFMQLAEEYRKEGQVNDALRVLHEGLKRHPNYWTARVSVGRIYYQGGDLVHALDELEIVIRAVPDNLLANRMVGDIYLRQNRPQEALKRYKMVQMLNPADQEVAIHIQKLETHLTDSRTAESAPTVMIPAPKLPAEVEEALTAPEEEFEEAAQAPVPEPAELVPMSPPEMEEFVDLGTIKPPEGDSLWDVSEPAAPAVSDPDLALVEPVESIPATERAPWNRTNEMPMNEEPQQPDLSGLAGMFLAGEGDTNELVDVREVPVTAADDEILEDSFEELDSGELEQVLDDSAEEALPDITQPMEEEEPEGDESADELTTESLAELYASQGLTDRAVKVYQKMLLNDPGNQRIVRRLQELNPIDGFLAAAAREESRGEMQAEEPVLRWESPEPIIPLRNAPESGTDDRRKKITTLENWLASIRRERS